MLKRSGQFVCDRCLAEFEKDLRVDYRMSYVYDRNDAGEIDKDEITVIHPSTNEIEIDEEVRQYILISVPLKLVCKESCAGLCPTCGKNLNNETCTCGKDEIDPRWEIFNEKSNFKSQKLKLNGKV